MQVQRNMSVNPVDHCMYWQTVVNGTSQPMYMRHCGNKTNMLSRDEYHAMKGAASDANKMYEVKTVNGQNSYLAHGAATTGINGTRFHENSNTTPESVNDRTAAAVRELTTAVKGLVTGGSPALFTPAKKSVTTTASKFTVDVASSEVFYTKGAKPGDDNDAKAKFKGNMATPAPATRLDAIAIGDVAASAYTGWAYVKNQSILNRHKSLSETVDGTKYDFVYWEIPKGSVLYDGRIDDHIVALQRTYVKMINDAPRTLNFSGEVDQTVVTVSTTAAGILAVEIGENALRIIEDQKGLQLFLRVMGDF